MTTVQLDRFMAKVYKESRGCWRWLGAIGGSGEGYGVLSLDGKRSFAHQAIFRHYRGPIPETHEIDHLCRNTRCVNPDHLEAVPHSENCRRGRVGQHNAKKTHCPHGHPYAGQNLRLIHRRGGVERSCWACHYHRSHKASLAIQDRKSPRQMAAAPSATGERVS